MPEAKQDVGLAMLAISSNFGSWSAWNSSLFTIRTFVDNKEKLETALVAMNLGLLTSIAIGAGIYYVYGERSKVAALASIGTGIVLYAAYWWKLKQNPTLSSAWKEMSTQKLLPKWNPLSNEEIQKIKNLVNSNTNSIKIVSEP